MSSSVGSIELILKCIKDINNEADEFNKTIKSFSGENKKIQEFMTRCVNEGIFWQNISQKIQDIKPVKAETQWGKEKFKIVDEQKLEALQSQCNLISSQVERLVLFLDENKKISRDTYQVDLAKILETITDGFKEVVNKSLDIEKDVKKVIDRKDQKILERINDQKVAVFKTIAHRRRYFSKGLNKRERLKAYEEKESPEEILHEIIIKKEPDLNNRLQSIVKMYGIYLQQGKIKEARVFWEEATKESTLRKMNTQKETGLNELGYQMSVKYFIVASMDNLLFLTPDQNDIDPFKKALKLVALLSKHKERNENLELIARKMVEHGNALCKKKVRP